MAHQAPAHSILHMQCAVLGRALTPCITVRLLDCAIGRNNNILLSWLSIPAELLASMLLGQWTSFQHKLSVVGHCGGPAYLCAQQ